MRYIIVLGDGMADRPVPELSGKTPLEAAYKPNMDRLCEEGQLGRMRTLYDDLPLGSDVANLSVLGFDPHLYYTGRSPIEALGLRIPLTDDDVVLRMNLVTLSGGGEFADKTMLDHSSDKITTEEAAQAIQWYGPVMEALPPDLTWARGPLTFYTAAARLKLGDPQEARKLLARVHSDFDDSYVVDVVNQFQETFARELGLAEEPPAPAASDEPTTGAATPPPAAEATPAADEEAPAPAEKASPAS